ncbi:MAG: RNA 2',3'-cyclic phosphodiesterase [Candidatus Kapabacteria bacterium]|nr:RNA 2',3'-cyclic phosphodiesterase [Candidatus Kapabacteria bacterium]
MASKRIFTGTFIDGLILDNIYDELQKEFKNATKGKWVEIENLHFTYHFIGDTEESVVEKIRDSLKNYHTNFESNLIIKGLGAFPDLRNPRVLFINVLNPDGKVFEIQKETTKILQKFGFKPEKREYHPHITLQRVKFADRTNFRKAIEKYRETLFGEMKSFKFNLIESILTPNGAIYKIIE